MIDYTTGQDIGGDDPEAMLAALVQPKPRVLNKALAARQVADPTISNSVAIPPAAPSPQQVAQNAPEQPQGGLPLAAGRAPQPAGVDAMSGYYDKADAARRAAFDKLMPSEEMLNSGRQEAMGGALAGMALQAMGGEGLAPAGGAMLKQAMAEQAKYTADPWKRADIESKRMLTEADAMEKRAALAGTLEEKASARLLAAELRREALAIQQQNMAMMGGLRADAAAARRDRNDDQNKQQIFQREHTLRQDYGKATKDITDAQRAAQQMVQLIPADPKTMTAQQQQALIFNFMKALDPGSVVRESEYAAAAKARGLTDTIGNYATQLQTGKPLTPKQVENMRAVGNEVIGLMNDLRKDYNNQFSTTAQQWGVDPRNFIRAEQGKSSPGAAAGTGREIDVGAVLGGKPPAGTPERRKVDF